MGELSLREGEVHELQEVREVHEVHEGREVHEVHEAHEVNEVCEVHEVCEVCREGWVETRHSTTRPAVSCSDITLCTLSSPKDHPSRTLAICYQAIFPLVSFHVPHLVVEDTSILLQL